MGDQSATVPETSAPAPFPINVDDSDLEELRRRLAASRWPETETVSDWSQGVPLAYMRSVADYWLREYDWRRCEQRINAFGSYRMEVDGLGIHFIHARSKHPDACPIVLTHGWPGSIVEFLDIIPMLTSPEEDGGTPDDAFHVVAPALPGFGFSDKPASTGWTVERIADAWAALMARLGYDRYFAQGGDWGSFVSTGIAKRHPGACRGVHVNMVLAAPGSEVLEAPTEAEAAALAEIARFAKEETGYSKQQSTRPQTLGYGLTDSPVGQAAWILEKFLAWTDNDGTPESAASRDHLLDNVMLYWLTASAASSARLYWESFYSSDASPLDAPAGCTIFPKENARPSRRWAETRFKNIIHWNEAPRGGHFAAMEQPAVLAREIRNCFRALRSEL